MTLTLLLGIGAFAFAQNPPQKNVDLGINLLTPKGQMNNLNFGDTLMLSFEISNTGTEDFKWQLKDTMMFFMTTQVWGQAVYNASNYVRFGMPDSFNLLHGVTDTLYLRTVVGDNLFSNNTGEIAPPHDAKICFKFAVWGGTWQPGDTSILFFDDPGFDGQAYNDWAANNTGLLGLFASFSGNNLNNVNVTFGTGANDICANGYPDNPNGVEDVNTKGLGINVYPNPTVNTLSLDYSADAASANVNVRIMDVTGRVLINKDLGRVNTGVQHFTFDVSALNSGIYLIQVTNDNGKQAISKFTKR